MTYLASFEQESAVGPLLISARVPAARLGEAVAVCIGLNLQQGVSNARIVGAEAPRPSRRAGDAGAPQDEERNVTGRSQARPTGRPQAPRSKRAISAEGLNAKKRR